MHTTNTLITCVTLITMAPAASVAGPNLRSKLSDLNIRLRTDHYALAGTIRV